MHRDEIKIREDKAKGDAAEADLGIALADLGASVSWTGKKPMDFMACARIQLPVKTDQDGDEYYRYAIAPDLSFWWRDWAAVSFAQVKVKKLNKNHFSKEPFFYLDEEQLFKMNHVAQTGAKVFFVVCCDELGDDKFVFVDIRDLQRDRIELRKVKVWDKPTFKIPLSVFRPINEIKGAVTDERIPLPESLGEGRGGADLGNAIAV